MKSILLLSLVLILVGCSDDGSTDVVVETVDGVEYVRNLSGLDTTRFPVEFVLEQQFGAKQEPLEEMFASVAYVSADPSGNVYVLDRGHSRLMAFDERFLFY